MEVRIDTENIKVVIKQKKIKRTYLRFTKDKELIISSPIKLTANDINNLIINNYDWLVNQIKRRNLIVINDDEYLLFGTMYKLDIARVKTVEISGNVIRASSRTKVDEFALMQIDAHFQAIIKKLKFKFLPELKFRKMRTRWGVCHYTKNKVVLNKVLIHLPWHLIDYVIYHELTHFKVPNHSKAFYQELEKICPNHRKLKTQVLEYGSLL